MLHSIYQERIKTMNNLTVASVSPQVFVGDPISNARMIITESKEAAFKGASIIVFPEFSLSGCTCGDLFYQYALIDKCKDALELIKKELSQLEAAIVLGFPSHNDNGEFLSCSEVVYKGETIFCSINGQNIGTFFLPQIPDITCCITYNNKPCTADIIINLCEGRSYLYSDIERANASVSLSKNGSLVITSTSGLGESTNDYVSEGYKCIAAFGKVIAEGCFSNSKSIYADINVIDIKDKNNKLPEYRELIYDKRIPYLLNNYGKNDLDRAFNFQVIALRDRLEKIGIKKAVIGISGGLDSTLALLVTVETFKRLELDIKNIIAVTMPCFGTSSKTLNIALRLMKSLGVTDKQIDISDAVKEHLTLIGHDLNDKNVTYENAQARERTQTLMDIANDAEGIVIGTGDMSEAALGFCTYGGDALSMYNVNAGVPKTLARLIVKNIADTSDYEVLSKLLHEIIDLPISPELVSCNNEISQITEDIIGPYLLHDYIMYYFLKGETPTDIFNGAIDDFEETFDPDTILKTIKTFYIRFFSNQFKREAMPDGPQIIDVSLSPRGGYSMPSDINGKIWLEELENL